MIICDIDGTVADASARAAYAFGSVNGGSKDATPEQWDKFFEPDMMRRDKVIPLSREVLEYMSHGHKIVMLTGRLEKRRTPTLLWLRENSIPYDELIMRPDGQHDDASEFKHDAVMKIITRDPDWNYIFIDDDDRNLDSVSGIENVEIYKAPNCWKELSEEYGTESASGS